MDVQSMCTTDHSPLSDLARPSLEGNTRPETETETETGPKATKATKATRATKTTGAKRALKKRQPKARTPPQAAQSTSTPPTPRRGRAGPSNGRVCPVCAKTVSPKAFADHIKVHKLATDEHGIAAVRPCRNCADKGRWCRIARDPGPQGLNTFRCMHCLQYHENCPYMVEMRGRRAEPGCAHPGMVSPPGSVTDPSTGTNSP